MRRDRSLLECGALPEDRPNIAQVPDLAPVRAAQQTLKDKKAQYKSALPW